MRNGGVQVRLGDILYIIRKRWTMIMIFTLVGLALGGALTGISYLQGSVNRNYRISASVAVVTVTDSGKFTSGNDNPGLNDYTLAADLTDMVMYIMKSDTVLKDTISDLNLLGISAGDISGNLSLGQYESTQIIEMNLTWSDAGEGVDIINSIVAGAGDLLDEAMRIGQLTYISEPSSRYLFGGFTSIPVWGYTVVAGFLAGIMVAVLELLMRPKLLNLKDVETQFGLETLGTIPEDPEYFSDNHSLLIKEEGRNRAVEQDFSAAAYIIRNRLGTRGDHHCFYVTSATNGEGKSVVAANLAIQLSDMEHKVLLVDLNTLSPTLGSLFFTNTDYAHTLNAVFRGDTEIQDAITSLSGYCDFLPMVLEHRSITIDGTIIDMIRELSQNYEYTIIDAPSVGDAASETLSLNQIADTALFVIAFDSATLMEIRDSVDMLDKSGVRVLGCIVNREQSVYKARPRRRASGLSDLTGGAQKKRGRRKKRGENADLTVRQERNADGSDQSLDMMKERLANRSSAQDEPGKESASGGAAEKGPAENKTEVSQGPVLRREQRNILDDFADDVPADELSDDEAVSELLKFGVEGDFDDEDNQDG